MFHLGLNLGYSYWIGLDKKTGALESFRFLLVPDNANDRRQYAQRYQLDLQTTDKFIVIYRLACRCIKVLVVVYLIFIVVVISRCLYHSFYVVTLLHFLSIGLVLSVTTSIAYLILAAFITSRFILMLLSAQFLVYRLKAINARLCDRFTRTQFFSASSSKQVKKQQAALLQVLHHLSDFCQQFQQINRVLDSSISKILVAVYLCLFVLPYFLIFVENNLAIRLFLSCSQ